MKSIMSSIVALCACVLFVGCADEYEVSLDFPESAFDDGIDVRGVQDGGLVTENMATNEKFYSDGPMRVEVQKIEDAAGEEGWFAGWWGGDEEVAPVVATPATPAPVATPAPPPAPVVKKAAAS